MTNKLLTAFVSGIVLVSASTSILGQNSGQLEPPYGPKLMTQQEMQQHREKMWSLQSREERQAYRRQIHEKMRQRALEKGLVIPNEPPAWGQGPGKGMGPGGKNKRGLNQGGSN